MMLRMHAPRYAIARLAPEAAVPAWALQGGFHSVTKTPDELSVVTEESWVPADVEAARGWTLFELVGPFDFDQVGILGAVIGPLTAAAIPVMVIATFGTDFLLIRAAEEAKAILEEAGHRVTSS
ncbi:MAG: ACT domain-containing protein [Bacteroidota bacterium]|nr:ACT domain-containing protein [Bacteroidota bacterium]